MNSVAPLSAAERLDLFQETATQRGVSAAVIEKDFWGLLGSEAALCRRRASYETALPGSLKLTPGTEHLTALRKDYSAMTMMIFGDAPTFNLIVDSLQQLEDRINLTSSRNGDRSKLK